MRSVPDRRKIARQHRQVGRPYPTARDPRTWDQRAGISLTHPQMERFRSALKWVSANFDPMSEWESDLFCIGGGISTNLRRELLTVRDTTGERDAYACLRVLNKNRRPHSPAAAAMRAEYRRKTRGRR